MALNPNQVIEVAGKEVVVWPEKQEVRTLHTNPAILIARFSDHRIYTNELTSYMLELEKDPEWTHHMHIGGSKISHVHKWDNAAARVLDARARYMFSKFTSNPSPELDVCWGNISRDRDYLTAHSHTNSTVSMVYFLDKGDIPDDLDSLNGRFGFIDPRLSYCCPVESQPDCMVRELYLGFEPGAMVMFPSYLIHHVHPYEGEKPRFTLAWNFR